MTPADAPSALAGRRILIVEDDPLVSMLEEDLLLQLGCRIVGPAATVAEALTLARALAETSALQGAVLDVNLQGEPIFPVADLLAAADIPFVFVTGYGAHGLPTSHAARPVIRKPFDPSTFGQAIAAALAPAGPGA